MSQRVQQGVVAVGLAIAIAVVYAAVLDHGFINLDDDQYVSANPMVGAGISLEGIRWALGAFVSFNWHPVTWVSHMLDVQLFGMDAGLHHAVSVALHIANSVLLFRLLVTATGKTLPAAVVAALFAVHPTHVESVAWIAERKDVLSTLFWLLTLRAYLAYCRMPSRLGMAKVALWFAIGLMAKPMLVTLPFGLLLLDIWPIGRLASGAADRSREISRCVREKLPLFAMSIASVGVTLAAQTSGGALQAGSVLSLADRVATALVSYARYLGLAIWPTELAIYYPHPGGWPSLTVVGAALLLLAITMLVCWQWRARPYATVGWFWFLGTLLPVIGLVQVGSQSIADRYTYVPFVGLFVAVVYAACEWGEAGHRRMRVVVTASCLAVLILAVMSWNYVAAWQDSITIFTHSLRSTDDAYGAVIDGGAPAHALGAPIHNGLYTPYYNLGTAYAEAQQLDLAQRHFEAAIVANSGFPEAFINMGVVLAQKGDLAGSQRYYEQALRLDPDNALAKRNLGILFQMMRR